MGEGNHQVSHAGLDSGHQLKCRRGAVHGKLWVGAPTQTAKYEKVDVPAAKEILQLIGGFLLSGFRDPGGLRDPVAPGDL